MLIEPEPKERGHAVAFTIAIALLVAAACAAGYVVGQVDGYTECAAASAWRR